MEATKVVSSPRILSDDLELRKLESIHSEALFKLTETNRSYLRKWLPWLDTCTKESDSLDFIISTQKSFSENTGHVFGIFYKGAIAGTAGFVEVDLLKKEAKIGYWLTEELQGLGIVTACCTELVKIGFQELQLTEIAIDCAVENYKSQNIALRLGFHELRRIHPTAANFYGTYMDLIRYNLRQDQWQN